MMEVLTLPTGKTSTCLTLFAGPGLTTFARLDELGLVVVGQRRAAVWLLLTPASKNGIRLGGDDAVMTR